MNTVEILSIITNENPTARRVYGVASTGEIVIERNGKRGRANVTVLSHEEAEREALRLKATWPPVRAELPIKVGLRDLLAIVKWGAELQAEVEAGVTKFFEMQQIVWLHLEENEEPAPGLVGMLLAARSTAAASMPVLNGVEDITNSNSDPEEYYPLVGTSLGVSDAPEEVKVNPVEVITKLKQEALTLPMRAIEFKAVALAGAQSPAATWTRMVAKADKVAFTKIKEDIKAAVQRGEFQSTLREIVPTLRVRPGFVYVNA